MTTDWIRPPRPASRTLTTWEGVRVVGLHRDERDRRIVLTLEDGRAVRVSHHELAAMVPPQGSFNMAEGPRGLTMPPPAKDAAPRGLALPQRAPVTPKQDLKSHAAPRGLTMPAAPSGNNTPTGLRPPPPAPDMSALLRRRPATPAVEPGTFVLGGDPRAPKMLARAKEIDAKTAGHALFHGRLQNFLDLAPTAWTTWGEDDARYVVQAASTQAEQSRQLSLANAVKWATECEQAYSKPPGFLDRLSNANKPEFFRVRLEQARDALTAVQAALYPLQDELRFRLERIRVDALALQVATEGESDPSRQITATRRLQTLVQVQTTGGMILAGCETLAQTCATQAGSVSDLLTVTIPNWIIAQKAR